MHREAQRLQSKRLLLFRLPTPLATRSMLTVLGVVAVLASGAHADLLCPPLEPPTGPVIEVLPSEAAQLRGIVAGAAAGTTILLHDGVYDMSHGDATSRLVFNTSGVTLRSASGDRDAVVLDGGYGTDELISIRASDIVIAELTLTKAYNHLIHMSGSEGDPISSDVVYDVRMVDPGQQAVKVNAIEDGYVDYGVIECSRIELTDAGRAQIRDNCYTGGIDVHKAWGWQIRRNWIEGFWCPAGLSEHGIHFWSASRDTLVEDNIVLDSARGIGFGLREISQDREYPDDPYPTVGYMGHIDGMIRNNFIAAADPGLFDSGSGFDTGITLEQAHGTLVYHNSVVSTEIPASSSIEWRFSNTSAGIANNLASDRLLARDGGTAVLAGNLPSTPLSWYTNVSLADLHLTSLAEDAVDAGVVLPPGAADVDIDQQARDELPDVGADERLDELIYSDDFESGDTSAWSEQMP